MSEFGDRTAQQSMLEWARVVQDDYELTDEELVIVLISVLGFINDPYENKLYEIRKNKRIED